MIGLGIFNCSYGLLHFKRLSRFSQGQPMGNVTSIVSDENWYSFVYIYQWFFKLQLELEHLSSLSLNAETNLVRTSCKIFTFIEIKLMILILPIKRMSHNYQICRNVWKCNFFNCSSIHNWSYYSCLLIGLPRNYLNNCFSGTVYIYTLDVPP